jgi:hypothetical protein
MKILLYSIFTNEYKKLIPLWLEHTASNFYPDVTDVLIITDDKDYISPDPKVKVKYTESSVYRNEELLCKNARHCAILQEFKDYYDLFVNLQSNCLLTGTVNAENFPIDPTKLTCFAHVSWPRCAIILPRAVVQKGSVAYKPLTDYGGLYVHAGMTIGSYEVMYKMNYDCLRMLNEDEANCQLHLAKYHDESYLNSWRVENQDKVNVVTGDLSYGPIDKMQKGSYKFYLIDKEEVGIKKKAIVAPHFPPYSRLGNNLFTFAAAYAHALRNGYDFHCPFTKTLYPVIGNKFNPNCDTIRTICKEPSYKYNKIPGEVSGFIHGYCQSAKYFSDFDTEIREVFKVLCSDDKKRDVAAIHIRLGDYVRLNSIWKSPAKEFIEIALSKLSDNIKTLWIFSDEPDKAKELVTACSTSAKFMLEVKHGSEIEDIRTMASAEEFIMSCSSFSWWAAYLGNHKKVIVDKKWYTEKSNLPEDDIYEPHWIKI